LGPRHRCGGRRGASVADDVATMRGDGDGLWRHVVDAPGDCGRTQTRAWARWLRLVVVNQKVVARRPGVTGTRPAVRSCDGDSRSTTVEHTGRGGRRASGSGGAEAHQERAGGLRIARGGQAASPWSKVCPPVAKKMRTPAAIHALPERFLLWRFSARRRGSSGGVGEVRGARN
jgi:hypothetical protein